MKKLPDPMSFLSFISSSLNWNYILVFFLENKFLWKCSIAQSKYDKYVFFSFIDKEKDNESKKKTNCVNISVILYIWSKFQLEKYLNRCFYHATTWELMFFKRWTNAFTTNSVFVSKIRFSCKTELQVFQMRKYSEWKKIQWKKRFPLK